MSPERLRMDKRTKGALSELQGMIQQRYPDASFRVTRGEDPEGFYLKATVDLEDTDEVIDLVIDRMLQMQIEDELPVYVIPVRPLERIRAMRAAARPQERWHGRRVPLYP